MGRLIDGDDLMNEVKECKVMQQSTNSDYRTGYISAMSTVEGMIADQFLENDEVLYEIDAIPMEWLEWRISHAEREGFIEVAKMLTTVRDWWNDQKDLWREEMESEENNG